MAKSQDGTITLEVWKWSIAKQKRVIHRKRKVKCRKTPQRFKVTKCLGVELFDWNGYPIAYCTGTYSHRVRPTTFKPNTD